MFDYISRQPTRLYSSFIKNSPCKKSTSVPSINVPKLMPVWMLVGSTGYIGCKYFLYGSNIVHCEHKELEKTPNEYFDWNKLLSYLSPDVFNLLVAITVSIIIIAYLL